MNYPAFYDQVAKITLRDPLAEFLGAAENGLIEYGYLDAVKLAGHSCPTVAGAYLATRKALAHLYRDDIPERGAIQVEFRDDIASGVTGVIANVVSLITGATQSGGFKGIGGQFDRRNLLFFNADVAAEIRFTRRDTGAQVTTAYRPDLVPPAPRMRELLQKILLGEADTGELGEFGTIWQDRVRRVLIDNADNPEMIVLSS